MFEDTFIIHDDNTKETLTYKDWIDEERCE